MKLALIQCLFYFIVVQTEGQKSNNHKKNSVIKQGNQPDGGQIIWRLERRSLPGHSDCDTIQMKFHFDDGIQSVSLWCALFLLYHFDNVSVSRWIDTPFQCITDNSKTSQLSVFLLCGILSGLFLIHFHGANGDTDRCVLITTEIPRHDSH